MASQGDLALILNVLTAVTRPQNLPQIAASLAQQSWWEIRWHLRLDPEGQNVGGQNLKNDMLDGITDGWVWILDDDTVAPPGLLDQVFTAICPWIKVVVVSQLRNDVGRLAAAPEFMHPGLVDAGQLFAHRDAIGDRRLPDDYNGDGMFIEALIQGIPDDEVFYLQDVHSFHNALR